MKRIMTLAVAALMVMALPSFAHANLLLNPGVEDGTYVNDQSIPDNWWTGSGGSSWAGRGWANDAANAHGGSKYVKTYFDKNCYAYWGQNVTGISEGAVLAFSAYLRSEDWGNPSAFLKVEFKDASNNTLRTDGGAAPVLTGKNQPWTLYTTTTSAAPSGTTNVNFVFYADGINDSGAVWMDDANAAIPEPASLLLLGTGLLGLFGISRRK